MKGLGRAPAPPPAMSWGQQAQSLGGAGGPAAPSPAEGQHRTALCGGQQGSDRPGAGLCAPRQGGCRPVRAEPPVRSVASARPFGRLGWAPLESRTDVGTALVTDTPGWGAAEASERRGGWELVTRGLRGRPCLPAEPAVFWVGGVRLELAPMGWGLLTPRVSFGAGVQSGPSYSVWWDREGFLEEVSLARRPRGDDPACSKGQGWGQEGLMVTLVREGRGLGRAGHGGLCRAESPLHPWPWGLSERGRGPGLGGSA